VKRKSDIREDRTSKKVAKELITLQERPTLESNRLIRTLKDIFRENVGVTVASDGAH
jgi:hypothetical protein